ncbi:M20/M25/M40 family metallo-hydrolase [Stigmatella aurantiaca]|uniref:Carboxypeptidase Q n=2 Tax=Stigmatella aurantiaca (strain DW4/3-1) TaxID=378806 RepID=E3FKF6_STIAD|nr:M20/M25/M40 family metallo-hydrolase [Stigmatella aurantiaca]ADO67929.1 Peptidase, M28D (Aminopeptidase ES-62) subfamily [Stigmatella aurantiaca DW4/3-1]
MPVATFLLPSSLMLQLLTATPPPAPAPKAAPPVAASLPVAERLVGAALTEGHAWGRLEELTDGVGARLSGSEGAEAAVQWALRAFKADGVKAWLEPVKVPHWVRGEERAELLASERFRGRPLSVMALGGSAATPPEGITGEVVEVRSLEELSALGERVKGRVVLFGHTMQKPEDYGRFAALRSRGPAAAAKAGAVAALVRSLATASLATPHTGATRFEEGEPRIPAASVTVEDAELLSRLVAAGGPVRVKLVLGCQELPDVDSFNVVAEVKGREKPQEVVLLGAHLDSWDVGTGAHDDGAGVVMVMEAARLLTKQKAAPRRTVRVVLFMNEENGLRGARAYAETHAAELSRHVAALELDVGGGRPVGVALRAGPGAGDRVRPWLSPLRAVDAGTLVEAEAGGADLLPLIPAQVPFFGVKQDVSRYFDVHHTHADTLDKVDPVALAQSTAAVTWLAYAMAEMPETLPRPEAPSKPLGP